MGAVGTEVRPLAPRLRCFAAASASRARSISVIPLISAARTEEGSLEATATIVLAPPPFVLRVFGLTPRSVMPSCPLGPGPRHAPVASGEDAPRNRDGVATKADEEGWSARQNATIKMIVVGPAAPRHRRGMEACTLGHVHLLRGASVPAIPPLVPHNDAGRLRKRAARWGCSPRTRPGLSHGSDGTCTERPDQLIDLLDFDFVQDLLSGAFLEPFVHFGRQGPLFSQNVTFEF